MHWTPHEVLLALAGRIDDDLLGWARELVAVGDHARATELVTATLVADRATVPGPVRDALVDACRAARADLDAATALPPAGPEEQPVHRFEAAVDPGVEAAVRDLPARHVAGCRVLLASRVTPAGTAPGPLPHPVVLVEVQAGGRRPDMLAYQLAMALRHTGVHASVEVLTAGRPVPNYHAAALRAARPVHEPAAEGAVERPGLADDATDTPPVGMAAPVDGAVPVGGMPHPLARPTEDGARPVSDQETTAAAEPVALRPAPTPAPAPARPPHSAAVAPEPDVSPETEDGKPLTDTPAYAERHDPLLGPVGAPLLDPLLDPTIGTVTPLAAAPAPDTADPGPDDWAGEWASGAWAMPASALTERVAADNPDVTGDWAVLEAVPDPEPPVTRRRHAARHRVDDGPPGVDDEPRADDGPKVDSPRVDDSARADDSPRADDGPSVGGPRVDDGPRSAALPEDAPTEVFEALPSAHRYRDARPVQPAVPRPAVPRPVAPAPVRPTQVTASPRPLPGRQATSGPPEQPPDPARSDLTRSDPTRSEPARSEPARSEPGRPEPVRSDPTWSDPTRPEPARSDPARSDPARSDPARSEPARPDPTRSDPTRSEPARPDPAWSEPAWSEPARSEPARSEPARSDPARPEPARSEPARLSDADRALLARLQSGLGDGRGPEPDRPAAAAEGSGE